MYRLPNMCKTFAYVSLVSCFFSAGSGFSAFAADLTYTGPSGGNALVTIGGTFGNSIPANDAAFTPATNSGSVTVTLDTTNLTLTFNDLSIVTGPATGVATGTVTTGFNKSSTITTTVTFNALNLDFKNLGTYSLIAGTGGNYTIGADQYIQATIPLSGSYTTSDGTNTYMGTFSVNLPVDEVIEDATLTTQNYPKSIGIDDSSDPPFSTFGYESQISNGAYGYPIFSQEFGTTDVITSIAYYSFLSQNNLTLIEAPEPSTWAMMLGGLALLGFCVRRRLA